MKQRLGFTLIEMMVVIAIVGILSSLVLIGLGPVQQRGRDARRLSDLRQVQTGLELYYSKNGSYPSADTWAKLQQDLAGAAIGVSKLPTDPRSAGDLNSANQYKYAADSSQSSYVLGATLEDKNNPSLDSSIGSASFPAPDYVAGWNCGKTAGVYCISL
jgi:prepilin-type N-terminal cleavage/methylation domain-containing protein